MGVPVSREDFVRMLFGYLDPLRTHYTADGARLVIGHASAQYEDEVIPMEAWARPLWGLGPFWAGGGHDAFFEDVYRRGLAAGTDPASPAYWGDNRDHDQKFIEMGAICYGLALAPHVLWEPLSAEERMRVAAWLGQINERTTPDSNWRYMRVLVNVALARLGMPHDAASVREDIERICTFYAGDGWYTDGPSNSGVLDYYNGFALHFDSLVYAWLEGTRDPEHAALFRERARLFAPEFARLFSARGEAVPFGRSITYRSAQCAFFSLVSALDGLAAMGEGVVGGAGGAADGGAEVGEGIAAGDSAAAGDGGAVDSGAEAGDSGAAHSVASDAPAPLLEGILTPAEVKGIVARNVGWWATQPVCDNGGVLSIGYRYPNLHLAESYNAAGSPMWSLKAFACLSLPKAHPFWTLEPAPLPAAIAEPSVRGIGHGDMLVQRDASGEVALYPSGRVPTHPFAQSSAKYAKLAYATRFGFSVARGSGSLEEAAPDSSLAFVLGAEPERQGRPARAGHVFVREGVEKHLAQRLESGALVMDACWSPWPGIEVETVVEPVIGAPAGTHVRRHRVTSSIPCTAYDCGFAVPGDYHWVGLADAERVCRVRGELRVLATGADGAAGASAAPVGAAGMGVSGQPCRIVGEADVSVAPGVASGVPTLVKAEANTCVSCGKTVIPAVRYEIPAGTCELVTRVEVDPRP